VSCGALGATVGGGRHHMAGPDADRPDADHDHTPFVAQVCHSTLNRSEPF
jgi:hypothetical protein